MIRIGQIFVMVLILGLLQLSAETPRSIDTGVGVSCGVGEARGRWVAGTAWMGVIQDPALHQGWRVVRIANHPEWPARLQRVSEGAVDCSQSNEADGVLPARTPAASLTPPIVHSGDVLVISEETAVLRGEFDAIALSNAGPGDAIQVRLRFSDKVVRVRVTAKGRAVLDRGSREVYR